MGAGDHLQSRSHAALAETVPQNIDQFVADGQDRLIATAAETTYTYADGHLLSKVADRTRPIFEPRNRTLRTDVGLQTPRAELHQGARIASGCGEMREQ